jgi:glycosyltransferase involved in cell wall biosynthesis
MSKPGYIPQADRKKILLLSDDIRFTSGISTMAKEIVLGTAHRFNWVNLGAAIQHPEQGKKLDICQDTNNIAGITDAYVYIYPSSGYGTPEVLRQLFEIEKPDVVMFFTDPRYWIWLFQMENEIRKKIPMIYLNIWDDLPAPLYNKPYYESCDALMAISKQTANINRMVLGEKAKDKVIKYVPHGINEIMFYPITPDMTEDNAKVQAMRQKYFGDNQPEFVVLYNARNIRRKCTSDLIAGYAEFCDSIGKEKAKRCALVLHTQPVDENGTDLPAVVDLLCDPEYQRVVFSTDRYSVFDMNIMYNTCDVVSLVSSNEGWGLSLTEGMMCGKPIIATVTGGMQDQMRFENEKGEWLDLTEDFPSNHFGTYKKHGEWAFPIYPSNMSIVGSVQTPYIFDDRADFRDVATQIEAAYDLKVNNPEKYAEVSKAARKWVTSDESMMTANWMSKNVIDTVEETLAAWKPKPNHEFIKITKLPKKKIVHPIVY